MAEQTVNNTLIQAINDFDSIRDGMSYVGFDLGEEPTSTYGDKIKTLKTELDSIVELKEQVENLTEENTNLNNQVVEDNTNFSDIYNAIVEKGQEPVEEDKSTYADAILAIQTSSGDYEINNCYHLFGVGVGKSDRSNLISILLPNCKNVTNWSNAFEGNLIPDGTKIEIDMTSITNQDNTYAFLEITPETSSAEITLKAKTNGLFRYLFYKCNYTNAYGLINIIINDISDGTSIDILSNLFQYSKNIKSIEISADLSNVKYLNYTFQYFNSTYKSEMLTELDLSGLNLDYSIIKEMTETFLGAKYLTAIIFPENTVLSNVYANKLFYNCTNLKEVNLDIVDTDKGDKNNAYSYMFYRCNALENIKSTQKWVIHNSTMNMFDGCNNLLTVPEIELHIYGQAGAYRNSLEYTYSNNYLLEEIYIDINYEDDTTVLYIQYGFNNCKALKSIKGNLDLSNIYNVNYLFSGCVALESIETTGSFGGRCTTSSLTLDLSASEVFDITSFINSLASNESGCTRIIKLNSVVYSALEDDTIALATTKNYTLASA